jgi:hypothetical protein
MEREERALNTVFVASINCSKFFLEMSAIDSLPGSSGRPMSREQFAFGSSGRWRQQKALEHRKNLEERDSPCIHPSSLQKSRPLSLLVSVA